MPLVVGLKRIQSLTPVYDGGLLTGILVRINRAIVDSATPTVVKHGLPTSVEVDIWPQLTAAQRTGAATFFTRVEALTASMVEFEA